MKPGHGNIAMTALLAGLALGAGPLFSGSTAGTVSRLRTRAEEDKENRTHADNRDAILAAEEKRKRKAAKRLKGMGPNY